VGVKMQVLGGNICIPQFFLLSLHLEMGIMERIPEKHHEKPGQNYFC
jgi:hypothetical protein